MTAAAAPQAETRAASGWKEAQGRRRYRVYERVIFVVGFFVYLPAIRARYLLDDYIHASMVKGTYPVPRGPFDLYDFFGDADRDVLSARGLLPWWSDPHLKVRFFRPLSSALIWTEHKLLGDAPLPLHILSFGWWVAVVLGARSLFRRVLSPRAALIATAMFALAPCHSLPLAWLANREALVSLTFGLFALSAMLRFHDDGRFRDAAAAVVGFSLSALSGEYAIGLGGYVLALALASRNASPRGRVLGLLFFAVPSALYLAVRSRLGYGSVGSGFYTDPLTETLPFLTQTPRRFATLVADAWLSLDGATVNSSTSAWWLGALFVVGAALVLRSVWRAFKGLDGRAYAHAMGLFGGSFLTLVPVLAVTPSPRLLGATMLGISATVGLLLEKAWFRDAERGRHDQLGGLLALTLAFLHFIHGPMNAWLVARSYRASSVVFEAAAKDLAGRLGDTKNSEVFVMRGTSGALFLLFAIDPAFAPPLRFRILSHTGHVLALRRGPRTLDLVATERLYPTGPESLFRSERGKVAQGDMFSLPGMRATVLEAGPLGPRIVRFETDRDLETYAWIADQKNGFQDASPPAIGFGKPFDP